MNSGSGTTTPRHPPLVFESGEVMQDKIWSARDAPSVELSIITQSNGFSPKTRHQQSHRGNQRGPLRRQGIGPMGVYVNQEMRRG